jgi:hypothetical protein
LSYEKIIEHASGDKTLELKTEEIKDDTGLIRFVPKTDRQRKIQKAMIPYCNLLYKSIYLYDHRMHLERGLDDAEIEIDETFEDIFERENYGLGPPELHDYQDHYKGMLLQLAQDFNEPEEKSRSKSNPSLKRQLSAPSRMNGRRTSKSKTMKRARSA